MWLDQALSHLDCGILTKPSSPVSAELTAGVHYDAGAGAGLTECRTVHSNSNRTGSGVQQTNAAHHANVFSMSVHYRDAPVEERQVASTADIWRECGYHALQHDQIFPSTSETRSARWSFR